MIMTNEMINSPEYIANTLNSSDDLATRLRRYKVSSLIAIKTLIYGRKWLIYLLLSLTFLIVPILSKDPLGPNPNAKAEFMIWFTQNFIPFLLPFGAFILSLPLTSDEISDNITELYLVRPISRENFYLSRVSMAILSTWIINDIIALIYYIAYFILDPTRGISDALQNYYLYTWSVYIMLLATIMYSTLFIFIGMLGSRGMVLGILVAIFDTAIAPNLFLVDSAAMPRTHLLHLTSEYFGSLYNYTTAPKDMTLLSNHLYAVIFMLVSLVLGLLYFRSKEFTE